MIITQYFAEFIGTFVFVLVILTVALRKGGDPIKTNGLAPLIIGLGLAAGIYITGGLGGSAHLNPAVSLIMGMNGDKPLDMAILVVMQVAGACCALVAWRLLKFNSL